MISFLQRVVLVVCILEMGGVVTMGQLWAQWLSISVIKATFSQLMSSVHVSVMAIGMEMHQNVLSQVSMPKVSCDEILRFVIFLTFYSHR